MLNGITSVWARDFGFFAVSRVTVDSQKSRYYRRWSPVPSGVAKRIGEGRAHLRRQALACWMLVVVSVLLFGGDGLGWADTPVVESQVEAYEAERPKTVVELQQFRTTNSIEVNLPDGTQASVTLINLNPHINRWYLLRISRNGSTAPDDYHLENPFPEHQQVLLDQEAPDGLMLKRDTEAQRCQLWKPLSGGALDAARRSQQVYAPLCDGRLYLRNPTRGHRTAIEAVTDFLRDEVPGGEAVVGFVKDTFFKDAYREEARTVAGSVPQAESAPPDSPSPALIDPDYADRRMAPVDLGIQVEGAAAGMLAGRWYAVKDNPGIFVSLIQPQAVAPEILRSYPRLVKPLDNVEADALDYMVAFDLERFGLGFGLGTEHPRVDWSERILPQMKIPGLPGPDGIGTIAPLVANGMVSPIDAVRTVATFTGGFKRIHGAFRYGELAYRNHGSHYGFMESGVVLSKLQPGLATLLILDDGTLEMKTWTEQDNSYLGRIVDARQNGVPIIEFDQAAQKPVPGRLVGQWLPGNWAGSEDKKLRTLRAGAALQQSNGRRFLIYGYFSTATPSAMARVFQAYGCHYAMHLDMNALEHTYLAVYRREGDHLAVEHLIQGMSVLDKSLKGQYVPRFLAYPDDRDFFYVMRRERQ
jgi:hypothetical protein